MTAQSQTNDSGAPPHPISHSLGFPTAADVRGSAERAAQLSRARGDEPYGMVIGPGVVRLASGKQATEAGAAFTTREIPNIGLRSPRFSQRVQPAREPITAWSPKSRARMIRVFAELDYSGLLSCPQLPAMITLTYPGDWLTVAPSADAVKRVHFKALAKRWQRSWGSPLSCVWKLEFQRRGAPHLHLFTVPPEGLSKSRTSSWSGLSFPTWLSKTWADIVAHPDQEQRRRHQSAGTAIDYADAITARDPKRLAVYFSKHAAPSLMSRKEYQHRVPGEWLTEGRTVGRFWGYLGLSKLTADLALTQAEFVIARRTLRRWSSRRAVYPAGCRFPSSVVPATTVRRIPVVDRDTGAISRYRTVRRRVSFFEQERLVGGYVLANDATRLGQLTVRAANIKLRD